MQEYVIFDGLGTRAVILPEKGATAVSFQYHGREFLYRDDDNLNSPERPRCGIPFLFPIFGRLKEGKYTWDGREYAMAIHGFGHTSAWQVEACREDALTLVLEANEETLSQYPFRFRVTLDFTVNDGNILLENTETVPLGRLKQNFTGTAAPDASTCLRYSRFQSAAGM